jgi:hypothetical protein
VIHENDQHRHSDNGENRENIGERNLHNASGV